MKFTITIQTKKIEGRPRPKIETFRIRAGDRTEARQWVDKQIETIRAQGARSGLLCGVEDN